MDVIHGFELLREEEIPELDSMGRLYRHVKTGAELLSIVNEDENKFFSINFRTPPDDSTGVPHIMEHSVLCGSRKYPVKELFVELVKGSLNTFLNAFTAPDKTCYPVASTNLQDFYNLVDVYMDAVLHPRLTPQVLQQEGWHYDLEEVDAPLTFKGVVYNEMKGVYSSPESVLYRYTQQTLFPDTTYGQDSGGDPVEIPDLTWEQFESFFQRYYHPSNARIFFYGDAPEEERLRLMEEYLQGFEYQKVNSAIDLQAPFEQPRREVRGFPVSDDEPSDKKAMVAVSWMLPEGIDFENHLAFQLLDYILIETPASPLRKALIESGLGEDLSSHGLSTHLRQMAFSTGLKGIALDAADEVEALILDTLRELAEGGIEKEMVAAALNSVEFALRENNTGTYPRGYSLMWRALGAWSYEGDPFAPLAFERPLSRIEARLQAGEPFFERLIQKHFLDNPHRVTLILKPDPEFARRREAEERARLEAAHAAMDREARAQIVEQTRALRELQETPDDPASLALIPRLELADLEREHTPLPIEVGSYDGASLLFHELPTNGILYLDLGLDLHLLPQELLPYAPLFGRALLEMGTSRQDFVRLSQRINRDTGGIETRTLTTQVHGQARAEAWLFLRGKALHAQVGELVEILHDVLLDANVDDQERFRQILLEEKAVLEAELIPMGHRVINRRLRAHFNEADWAEEQIDGIAQLLFLRDVIERMETEWPAIRDTLLSLRDLLVNRSAILVNVTTDEEGWAATAPQLHAFLVRLPTRHVEAAIWSRAIPGGNEGLAVPAQVNYVGKAANLYDLGYEMDGSALVISRWLRTTYLWERIRMQGGAYGAFSVFAPRSGIFSYLSYRDPNLMNTLSVYSGSSDFLRNTELDESELTKAIIGAISDIDSYQLPDAKGWSSMERYLARTTDEYLQQLRDEVLSTSVEDFRAFADTLDHLESDALIVVMGHPERLTAANEELAEPMTVTRVL